MIVRIGDASRRADARRLRTVWKHCVGDASGAVAPCSRTTTIREQALLLPRKDRLALIIRNGELRGCSVGDSEASLIYPDGRNFPLTTAQVRKPRIGTGHAMPRSFGPITLDPGARILAFTDGAFPVDHHERLVARAATTYIGDVIDELAMRALGAGEASDDCSAFLIDCDRL